MNSNDRSTRTAALNIATLAAFEVYYGPIPQELVAHIFSKLKGIDYTVHPSTVILVARKAGLQWMASKLEKEVERERFYNSTGIKPETDAPQQGDESNKKDSEPGENS